MTVRWLLAWAHLLGLGIGLGAVWARGRAFREPLDAAGLKRVFAWDAWWGAAAGIWVVTGLARAFGPIEKGSDYYLHNGWFLAKMALFLVILALEIVPMTTLIRWRIAVKRGTPIDTARAGAFARMSDVQAVLVVLMALCATAMARGVPLP
jgi:putative membrane protein